ncbi:N-terminal methionine N(alpha)-acetyltransferase NatC [Malassezia furfur]|uniref:N-terminal methionine N(Alpha)-acetyltransferase NatC n=1 Tax=Malassezia furfur TaxID=55194 RepID=A0ABY8ESH7_MALFU|nr:N-terminal methionine N(alpha)-acetyltransferase NatC [Malassezia furfur]
MTTTHPQVSLRVYDGAPSLPDVMRLIETELSEPYNIYTYRYFLHQWPHLCFLAYVHDENDNETAVGVIIGRLDRHLRGARLWRGYIAMLSVDPRWRGHGIGAQLIRRAVDDMVQGGAAEIVLETEVDNAAALRLYERLGFLREKRLYRFYLNGKDSFRLVLPIPAPRSVPVPGGRVPPPRPPRHPAVSDGVVL